MPKKDTKTGYATNEQIEAWKKKHGEVFEYEVDGKICYLRSANRTDLSHSRAVGGSDSIKFNETLLNDLWLAGNDDIRYKEKYFLGIQGFLDDLIEIEIGSLEKL